MLMKNKKNNMRMVMIIYVNDYDDNAGLGEPLLTTAGY